MSEVRISQLSADSQEELLEIALPVPEAGGEAIRGYDAPVGEIEIKLSSIWSDILRVERVGRHENFFEIGGHSLLAVTMMEQMRREGMRTDVHTFFTAPTLQALAEAIRGGSKAEVETPPNLIPEGCQAITPEMLPLVKLTRAEIDIIVAGVPGGAANIQDIYPLAPLQEGLLFHHLMGTRGDAYIVQSLLAFGSRERLDGFVEALKSVIARHDILRTAVVWEGLHEPVQVVWREARLPVEEVVLDASEEDVADQLCARFDPQHIRLDVRQAPLMRCVVAHDAAKGRWLLLWLNHHLTADHTALEMMIREAQASLVGESDRLSEPLPFRSFVAQARRKRERGEDEAFFREMLGDVEEPTAPYGLLEVRGDGSNVEEARMELDVNLAGRLRERARAMGVSAASVWHVAWGRVLGLVSGREDVVFGTVLFGRMGGGGADHMLGSFITTLPIRIGVGEESVEWSVRRTHARLGELVRHEHASLALAQRCSGVAAPTPLFSSLLNYRHSGREEELSSATAEAWAGVEVLGAKERNNYPLMLLVDDLGDGFALTARVVRQIEPRRVCEYMVTALEQLVEALERGPEREVRAIGVLPEAEKRQLLEEWNETEAAYPKEKCVHELFEEQVERRPDAVAVVNEDEQLSYAELNARANRLAHHLRGMDVGPDVRVAICLERSMEMVVALLAVLKTGGTYVPLDPEYPLERLGYLLEDARVGVVVTKRELEDGLRRHGGLTVCLDCDQTGWAAEPSNNPSWPMSAEGAAYVIYTSGSTGAPKGVVVRHRNLVNYTHYMCGRLGLREAADSGGRRFATVSTITADLGNTCIYPSLVSGGCLHILSYEVATDGHRYREYVKRQPIDVLKIVPSHLSALLGVQSRAVDILPSKQLILGGEALSAELVGWIAEQRAKCEVINHYGPTETTIGSLTASVNQNMEKRRTTTVPIGRPIANTEVYVLDRHGEPVPIGVVGELYIGGAGVSAGYLSKAEQTAERFVPQPFSTDAGARMYRTGDLVRYLPSGEVEFVGRSDHQVKIRGYRIELGEIEARMAEHPEVREAVVLAREEGNGGKRLVAYYTGREVGAEALRAHLSSALPEYMIPTAYVHLESLPLTPNGKVDRQALPEPDEEAYVSREYEAPEGEIETTLAKIWSELLGVERVGRNDNFFELGGHSMLAMRVIARIRERLSVDIEMRELFEAPILSVLATYTCPQESPPEVPQNRIPRIEQHPHPSENDIEIII
jgi:amino acid adenylation domain-containing protein